MYDRQTRSYWSQLLGEAVEGELIGTKLEFLPSWMMTWEEWVTLHPETIALEKGYRGARDPYARGYYNSPSAGVIGETFRDDRLYVKEFVIGVNVGDAAVAYPFSVLNDEPVVNDTIADTPVVVVFDADGAAGAVYGRQVGDQTLTFSAGPKPFELVDSETGTVWDGLSGEAVSGPLAGELLTRQKSTTVFWFGWKDFHPETAVYGLE